MAHSEQGALLSALVHIFTLLKTLILRLIHGSEEEDPPCDRRTPLSVNFHLTRECNYSCKFCFHTMKTRDHLPLEQAQRGLQLLKESGMRKINFSGGEPFLPERGKYLAALVRFCKEDLALESVSIVSNGSLITEQWMKDNGRYVDILAISVDSFHDDTNEQIGRKASRKKPHVENMQQVREWCEEYNVLFKINTVVNVLNWEEDMNAEIERLRPARWKVFQCLLIEGENVGDDALRDASKMVISKEQFQEFLDRHASLNPVAEDNETMMNSYLILDERMRFLNCQNGAKEPSKSILDVGVEHALDASGFDEVAFFRRGGKYEWTKSSDKLDW